MTLNLKSISVLSTQGRGWGWPSTWFVGIPAPSSFSPNENQHSNCLIRILQFLRRLGGGLPQCWRSLKPDSDKTCRHSHPHTSWKRHFIDPGWEHTGQQTHISYFTLLSQWNSFRMHSSINLNFQWTARDISALSLSLYPLQMATSIVEAWHQKMTEIPWSGRMWNMAKF